MTMHAIEQRRLATLVALPAAMSLVFSGVALAQDDVMAPDESVSGTVVFWNGYGADGDEITTFRNEVLPAFARDVPERLGRDARRSPTTTCARSSSPAWPGRAA